MMCYVLFFQMTQAIDSHVGLYDFFPVEESEGEGDTLCHRKAKGNT